MAHMTQFEWIVGSLAIAALAIAYLWLIRHVSKSRLMRCPDTGGIALVNAERVHGTMEVRVRKCDLWRENRGCTQGCLARYPETSPRYQVTLNALRPFDYR